MGFNSGFKGLIPYTWKWWCPPYFIPSVSLSSAKMNASQYKNYTSGEKSKPGN